MFDDHFPPADDQSSNDSQATNTNHDEPALPVGGEDLLEASSSPSPSTPSTTQDQPDDRANDDLTDIKKKALSELTPLVGKLDQTPSERFNTTMMMLQASDNQDLIKEAYDAAQMISDDKERAQALLDVVNEINYFSSKNK